jgi:hypothetical protein
VTSAKNPDTTELVRFIQNAVPSLDRGPRNPRRPWSPNPLQRRNLQPAPHVSVTVSQVPRHCVGYITLKKENPGGMLSHFAPLLAFATSKEIRVRTVTLVGPNNETQATFAASDAGEATACENVKCRRRAVRISH